MGEYYKYGTSGSNIVDVSTLLPDIYTELSAEDFFLVPQTIGYAQGGASTSTTLKFGVTSYDSSIGKLTLKTAGGSPGNIYCNYTKVYVILGTITNVN